MAKLFESHVKRDPNFEVPAERHLGLVVFCLKVRDVNSSRSSGGLSGLFCYFGLKKTNEHLCDETSLSLWTIIIEVNDDYLQRSSLR